MRVKSKQQAHLQFYPRWLWWCCSLWILSQIHPDSAEDYQQRKLGLLPDEQNRIKKKKRSQKSNQMNPTFPGY
jgi:hypothetical protein